MKRPIHASAVAAATVADDAGPSDPAPIGPFFRQEELDRLSVSDYALVTGDYGPFDEVIEQFIREENAKVSRAVRILSGDTARCRRCDHLRRHHPVWPGPCEFPLCACSGPRPTA